MSTKVNKANAYRNAIPVGELIPEGAPTYQFKDSVALCDHIRVLDLSLVRRKLGRLSDTAIIAVGNGLANVFDLR
jgi:mRNA-degrading endonuclease toxin of MazEF toxin-antitoxin module